MTAIAPATEISALRVIAPAFAMLPMVKPLPAVVELIASLTVTAKLFVFPTTVKFPFASAATITEARMLAVPVTVKVEPVKLQFVPEVPILPEEEILSDCAVKNALWQRQKKMMKELRN
jgi:hypothetical protein